MAKMKNRNKSSMAVAVRKREWMQVGAEDTEVGPDYTGTFTSW